MESLGDTSMSRLSTIGLPKPIVLKCSICFNEVNIAYYCTFCLLLMYILGSISINLVDILDILVISIDCLYKLDIPNIYGVS